MLPCFGAFFYVAARCFSRCLIFWCFWIKPKARKKESKRIFFFDRSFGKQSCPSDCASPARSGFTTFCHQKVVPKVSARRKAAGNSQRLAKTGACRGFASKPAPFFNARRCSFLFPHFSQCGDCCALRATMILISFYSVLAGLRPAGSHCENSGSSDGTGASARSGCANQRSLLCPLSERGCRHPLLFAVLDLLVLLDQAKSTRKESVRKNFPINFSGIIPSQCLEDFLRGADLPPFGDKRWRQKCPQGEKVGERPTACA